MNLQVIYFLILKQELTQFHHANLIVASKRCVSCLNNNKVCSSCQIHHKFYTIADFCLWLLEQNHFTCIAHNFKEFDGMFILRWFSENIVPCEKPLETIINGTKVISLTFKKLKFIDSLSFIPSSLAAFTKTFDLKDNKKRFFSLFVQYK
jgi:hypothetical protein